MLARHVLSLRPVAEEIIAFCLNLGHARIETTFESYSRRNEDRRAERIAGIGRDGQTFSIADLEDLAPRLIQSDPEKAASLMADLARRAG